MLQSAEHVQAETALHGRVFLPGDHCVTLVKELALAHGRRCMVRRCQGQIDLAALQLRGERQHIEGSPGDADHGCLGPERDREAGEQGILHVVARGDHQGGLHGWATHYAPRGVNGPIEDILFPINHGILYYPGYTVLPPFVAYRVDRMDEAGFQKVADQLRERMRSIETTAPTPYRMQNGGDYQVPSLELRPELGNPGASGFALHVDRMRVG